MTDLGAVAIVGAGQVGTMVGAALLEDGPSARVTSVSLYDADPQVAQAALALGGGTMVLSDPLSVLQADVVVLAVPLTEILAWLEEFGPRLRTGLALLDTGSAKAAVVAAMARLVPPGVHAMGGHPMAGSEESGPSAAVPGALRDAPFVLSPCRTDPEALRIAIALVTACGARPLVVEAVEHDRLVARTSHLPHLVASALAVVAAEIGDDLPLTRALVGSGFRSSTRLAASDSRMVAAFASANRRQLEAALREFRQQMETVELALAAGPVPLEEALGRGRQARELVLGRP
ncbi:MAG TPA: prephenate dehydrogenase/arogenate dehydrogenase family protein [Candidatus Dormibacteraeota bacterium]|nr:prephenate dehydrogenase/arogenate dehydrogenase family protein [Candidatus Dormibacteraeota bacterium]